MREIETALSTKSFSCYDFSKIVFSGIKSLKVRVEKGSLEDELYLYESIIMFIGTMTPRQFMNVFPIDKDYDGSKYDCKDYFYTMKKCTEYGLDKPITDAFDFLWDYWNRETSHFVINYMSVMSDIRKKKTGRSILEEFATERGIKTYAEKQINGETYFVENIATNSKGEII